MSFTGTSDEGGVERLGARTTLSETAMASEVRPVGLRRTVSTRGDRINWGAVASGALVAVATYVLLELALLAIEALDLAGGDGGLPDGALWTVLAAAIAFFLGGLVAGASIASRGPDDGVLHGIASWALAATVLILLAALGTGLLLGAIETVFDGLGAADQGSALSGEDRGEVAGTAALTLGAAAVAAALGGLIGSKLWPRVNHDTSLGFQSDDLASR